MRRLAALFALVAALGAAPAPASHATASPSVPLSAQQRSVLDRYLSALAAGRYDDAYALLSAGEQRYFGNARNYASAFLADRLKISNPKILRAEPGGSLGVVAFVTEHVEFFDHAHQAVLTANARVAYGLLNEHGTVRVKDPNHPWRAFDPAGASAAVGGLNVIVRKISFFTGRLEMLVTFVNTGDQTVTILPYGRSVLRDDKGNPYRLIETKLPSLTDRNLRLGLLLASGAEYTGALTFFTPDRFTPASLSLTVAPMLRDGADAPFEVALPPIPIPG